MTPEDAGEILISGWYACTLVYRHCAILSNSSHARNLQQKYGVPGQRLRRAFS